MTRYCIAMGRTYFVQLVLRLSRTCFSTMAAERPLACAIRILALYFFKHLGELDDEHA